MDQVRDRLLPRKGDKQLLVEFWLDFLREVQTEKTSLPLFAEAYMVDAGAHVNLNLVERNFEEKWHCWLFLKLEQVQWIGGLWLQTTPGRGDPRVFNFLLRRKGEIEKALGLRLEWDFLRGRNKESSPFGIVHKRLFPRRRFPSRGEWQTHREMVVDVMTRIHRVFGEHLGELPQS